MFAKNLTQTPAGAIADNRAPYAPGSNETSTRGRVWFGIFQNAQRKRFSTDGGPLRPNALEFQIQSKSARLRKTKTFLHLRTLVIPSGSRGIARKLTLSLCNGSLDSARDGGFIRTAKVFPEFTQGKPRKNSFVDYGVAEAAGEDVVLIVVFVSVLFVVAGEGFTTVVLVSFFSPPGGFTVSVFCSQAASNDAAPARMQMYFFIRL